MKYISMKMDPKGSSPPAAMMTSGRRYHTRSGMGDGMRFTLRHCNEREGVADWRQVREAGHVRH